LKSAAVATAAGVIAFSYPVMRAPFLITGRAWRN
jgi:hypothetical protein